MTKQELEKQLSASGFRFWRDDEYHRDAYFNENADVKTRGGVRIVANLEFYIDYYTIRIVWRYAEKKKVAKTYYITYAKAMFSTLGDLLTDFVEECFRLYRLDLNKYTITE